nr:hypothetical protein [Caldimonas sp.]
MSTRNDAPIGDGERDAWLREALRHAPDADAAPPRDLSETILAQARAAARVGAPARNVRRPNPVLALWDWLARPPVAAGFASVMAATLVGLMWWDRPIDETLPPPPDAALRGAPSSPQADAGGVTHSTEQLDRNLPDRARLGETRPPFATAPAAPAAPGVGAIAPAPQPARRQRAEESTARDDKAPSNAAKVLTPQAPPPPQATIEAKEQRRKLEAAGDAPPADRAAPKPSPFPRSDDERAGVAATIPAKKSDSTAKDNDAGDRASRAAPADALAKSKSSVEARPQPAEVMRSEPPATFGRERANELARAAPSGAAEGEAAKRSAGAMSQTAPGAAAQAAPPPAAAPAPRDSAGADGAREKRASAFSPPQAAQMQSELASAQRGGAGATPLAPIVAAIANDPARWSRATAAGGVVALETGWRDWLAQLDAAARGRWQPLGAADQGERDGATTLRLVDGGRTSAVVRLDGTTARVDAIDGGRWQATLPPAAAERLRAAAERLGR